jgi:hypothetical protein
MSDNPASMPASSGGGPVKIGQKALPFALLAWLPWMTAAGFALLAGFLGQVYFAARSEVTTLREQAALAEIEGQTLRQRMEAERILSSRRTADLLVELRQQTDLARLRIVLLITASGATSPAQAVAIWDAQRQEGELAAFQLAPLAPDRSYRIWIIDPQYPDPVSAGAFTVAQSTGDARIRLKPEKPIATASRFAITAERTDGEPRTDGPFILSSP